MEKVKEIIAPFIKKQASEITDATIINKSVIQGSILIHRMYAELVASGFKIDDYTNINTFGDLLQIIDGNNITHQKKEISLIQIPETNNENKFVIGIDIEKISNFKQVTDFREDEFYKQNFSEKELAYCILQSNPLQSFAGKFAAKEAIVKADNQFKNIPFHQIEILHDSNGKPFFSNFSISISHTDENAVAVAVKNLLPNQTETQTEKQVEIQSFPTFYKLTILFALLISIISIILGFLKNL